MTQKTPTTRRPGQRRTGAEKVAEGKARRDSQKAKATAKEDAGQCRGRWSTCGGREPSLSAKWHLGAECTKAYRAAKRAEHKPKDKADNVVQLPAARTEQPARKAAFASVELEQKAKAKRAAQRSPKAPQTK